MVSSLTTAPIGWNGKSCVVMTAATPGNWRALLTSYVRILACANGLPSTAPWSMNGRTMSSVYRAAPLILPTASSRGRRAPIAGTCAVIGSLLLSWRPCARLRSPSRSPSIGTGCPASPSRIWSSLGRGFSARSAVAATTMPGMQKPHWIAPVSTKACCTGESWPSLPNPSTVVTVALPTSPARHRHARAAIPSIKTVQLPHTP